MAAVIWEDSRVTGTEVEGASVRTAQEGCSAGGALGEEEPFFSLVTNGVSVHSH